MSASMKATWMSKIVFSGFFTAAVLSSVGCGGKTKTELGTIQVGSYSAHVFIEGDVVAAGAKSRMVIKVTPGMPTSITGWIGTMTAEGSTKAQAVYDSGDGDFDDDVVAPSPLPPGALFWFEIDTDGTKDLGSIPFAK
jgi:hypothetical protein